MVCFIVQPCKEIEDEKKLARKKRFNTLTAADKQQEEQKARQELVGDEEAKRKRIEKFGKPLMLPGGSSSDPDKLKQRAARFGKALAPAGGAAVSNTDDDARKKVRRQPHHFGQAMVEGVLTGSNGDVHCAAATSPPAFSKGLLCQRAAATTQLGSLSNACCASPHLLV